MGVEPFSRMDKFSKDMHDKRISISTDLPKFR
jgi:hypothetical protein